MWRCTVYLSVTFALCSTIYVGSALIMMYTTSIMQCLFGVEPECKLMQFAILEDAYIWNVAVRHTICTYIHTYKDTLRAWLYCLCGVSPQLAEYSHIYTICIAHNYCPAVALIYMVGRLLWLPFTYVTQYVIIKLLDVIGCWWKPKHKSSNMCNRRPLISAYKWH